MLKRLYLYCFILLCHNLATDAQTTLWEAWQDQIDSLGIVVAPPLENQFRFISDNNPACSGIAKFNNTLALRGGDLEIRYLIQELDTSEYPHIATSNLLMNLATNDPERAISVLSIDRDILEKDYKADWGVQAFFHPKLSFSNKEHAKLIAIYKENSAAVFMVLLFDDAELDLERFEFVLTFDSK